MTRIDEAGLLDAAREVVLGDALTCRSAAAMLGGAASWFLTDAVLKAAEQRGSLAATMSGASKIGSCFPLLVLDGAKFRPHVERGVLRGALTLPLRWVQASAHDPRVPTRLREAASRVSDLMRQAMVKTAESRKPLFDSADAWREGADLGAGLRLGWSVDDAPDLGALEVDPGSAWMALALGFTLASLKQRAEWNVFTTSCFDETDGPSRVSGLFEKIDFVRSLGDSVLFVSPADEVAAKSHAGASGGLRIHALKAESSPLAALGQALALAGAVPLPDDPLDRMLEHHRRLSAAGLRQDAAAFYSLRLFDRLIEATAAEFRNRNPTAEPVDVLISFVSTNPELTAFAVQALKPRRVVLFSTVTTNPKTKGAEERPPFRNLLRVATRLGQVLDVREPVENPRLELIERALRKFVADLGPDCGRVVVDVTPGTKEWAIAALRAGIPNARFVYLATEWGAGQLTGTERLIELGPLTDDGSGKGRSDSAAAG